MIKKEKKSIIWIVGDSTVSSFHDAYYYPRFGWGTKLGNYFDLDRLEIRNLALSGRSSLSYQKEENYRILMEEMKEGDFLFVGFGHNDEKMEAARFTSPVGDEKTLGSFAYSLYTYYVVPAKKKGCQTILCTPIVRRPPDGHWKLENLHQTETNGVFLGGDYAEVIRQMGRRLKIPVVDLTVLTKEIYDQMGSEETLFLHAWNSSKKISVDNTHTNEWGAFYNAFLVAREIKAAQIEGLSEYVLDSEICHPPAKELLHPNPEYQETVFYPDLKQSIFWEDYGCLKGTVFGSVGEKEAINRENFILEKEKTGGLHLAVFHDKGKIASTEDGIAMYYIKLPASAEFTLSAQIKIHRIELNDQVSFGLMVRDDLYIDTWMADVLGDYVAAGPLKLTQMEGGAAWNNFARKSGVLTRGGTLKNIYHPGDCIKAEIRQTKDGYVCQFGEEEAVSGGFDFQLTSIDPEFVYAGMFAARNCDITFSEIQLVVNGKERKILD